MKIKTKLVSTIMIMALVVGTLSVAVANPTSVEAAEKAYGDTLKLNDEIKLNKTTSYEKTGVYDEYTFFKKKKKIKIKYTIKCSQKELADKYKVTYKVHYKFLGNPKLDRTKITYDDWAWGFVSPLAFYTVFDYNTGISLDAKNNLGVKVKSGEWKTTYYSKQYYSYKGTLASEYEKKDCWIQNYKEASTSFTVTYPKDCKNVVVGIGFSNRPYVSSDFGDEKDAYFESLSIPYGKSIYYKDGKNTVSYMRLNNN